MRLNQQFMTICVFALLLMLCQRAFAEELPRNSVDVDASFEKPVTEERASAWAKQVKIYRDRFGTPHIDGRDDASTLFGFAFAQAEDNFWQLEDNYIRGIGRYAEVHGAKGFNGDLLNRSFEIVATAQRNYQRLDPKMRELFDAFSAGINFYLQHHPQVKPRLIKNFEPWHTLAFGRHSTLELCYRYTRLNDESMLGRHDAVWHASGSNAWAIGPKRTQTDHAMLMVNPHLPWFGFSTMYEAHLRSGAGWSFTGATFFGNPMLSMGHNEHLGWTVTTNEPDIADVWIETFDNPSHKLHYRYDGDYRPAVEWTEVIRVRSGTEITDRRVRLRKTHHGPIVKNLGDGKYLSARIAGLEDTVMLRQSMELIKARNYREFRAGLAMQQFPMMNIVYADQDGTIAYLYNGLIPRRDEEFNWTKPVDGANPLTEWQGYHSLDELPELVNPADGFVQNCNSSPFTTCTNGNLSPDKFPGYLCEDATTDRRRAKMSRQLLHALGDTKFEDVCNAAFDTTVYWALIELPNYRDRFADLTKSDPQFAGQIEPYLQHLLDWDCRITADSTQATLCAAWYEELYGLSYPGETLLPMYAESPEKEFSALIAAVARLTATHGKWKVPWKDVYRMQRSPNVVDMLDLPFSDTDSSLPCLGAPGQMGVIFTQYYSPSLRIPFIRTLKRRYGLVGASYMAVYEFGDKVRGASTLNFGNSGDPQSPHYFDQAKLLSDRRLKPEIFHWPDVLENAVRSYHPGTFSNSN